MVLISHRGNINGKMPQNENHPDYIDEAIHAGYNVEVDVWMVDNELFLGHDEPQYKIIWNWLSIRYEHLWIHCKNVEAMEFFNENGGFNYFWHEEDTLTLTSMNVIWAYPGKQPIKGSIAVMPEIYNDDLTQCVGICSDYIQNYNENRN
jgi:hypothetical protein